MELSDLTQAILFLLPGFLAVEVKNFLTPTRRRSDFERLWESVILSLVAYGVTYSIFLTGASVVKSAPPTIRTTAFVVPDFVVAILLGYLWAKVLKSHWFSQVAERVGVQYTAEPSFWAELLRFRSQGPLRGGWVRVYLEDGTKYIGTVTRFTTDPNEPDRELVLEQIYSVGENGLPDGKPLPIRLYIPASRIVAMHILPPPSSVAPKDATSR